MRVHELKTRKAFFEGLVKGSKKAELRRDDRGFANGDLLVLQEADLVKVAGDGPPKVEMTGRAVVVKVTHIVRLQQVDPSLAPDWVMLSFEEITRVV